METSEKDASSFNLKVKTAILVGILEHSCEFLTRYCEGIPIQRQKTECEVLKKAICTRDPDS